MEITSWINQLSIREQAGLLTGKDSWHTASIDRMGIPSIMVSDGPTGLRKEKMPGVSIRAICYPSAAAIASSWDKSLVNKLGKTLGDECLANRVSVLLGPGINIKRSPLCGRNFEYYSEDPVLAGTMAANYINGVQSKGVGTSIKHFAANSTEKRRTIADSIIDERAMREIYLRGFEIAVKDAQPWTIMAAYNKINGKYCTQNHYLLTEILRDEWGFEGLVESDWNAVSDRVAALKAGLDLEMPSSGYYGIRMLAKAYREGKLTAEDLESSGRRVLRLVGQALPALETAKPSFSMDEHHQFAREAALGCPVLLKNGGKVLPLNRDDRIAVIGARAKEPLYQGGGSAQVNAYAVDTPFLFLSNELRNMTYAEGYDLKQEEVIDETRLNEAVENARNADKVLLFVSCRQSDTCEGADRPDMKLPACMNRLVEEVCKVNDHVAVILTTGSSVELPWADAPDAILQTYLLGEAYGGALTDILLGKVSPSGKLAESYPFSLEDTPCPENYQPDENDNMKYKESIFVGYRYYDASGTPVRYPFGYGLSYTHFDYSDIRVDKSSFNAAEEKAKVRVTFNITNTGKYDGAEIAQVYVGAGFASRVYRAPKELKAFEKVFLKAGEMKTVSVDLDRRAFEYYSDAYDRWAVEPGMYQVQIGASSADIKLQASVAVSSDDELSDEYDYRGETPNYYLGTVKNASDDEFDDILGYDLEDYIPEETETVTAANCIADAKYTSNGKNLNDKINDLFDLLPSRIPLVQSARDAVLETPIVHLTASSKGLFSEKAVDGIVHYLNGGTFGEMVKMNLSGLSQTAVDLGMPIVQKVIGAKDKLK